MGLSRQAYYQGRRRAARQAERAQAVVQLVQRERMRQPRVGTRKLLPDAARAAAARGPSARA